MTANLSLYTTTAVFVIDSDGNRLLAKYYVPPHHAPRQDSAQSGPGGRPSIAQGVGTGGIGTQLKTLKEQRSFEKAVWDKTRKSSNDILLYQGQLVVFKSSIDVTFYVVGPEDENELMLQSALAAYYDAVSLLLRHQVEKRAILENLDLVTLCLDETVDDGVIFETDPVAIASRVSRPKADTGVNLADLHINEQTIMQAFSTLRDKAAQRILQGSL